MSDRKKMKRGDVRTAESVFVGAWLPISLVERLDKAVASKDSDRSKIVREALREKLEMKEAA